MATSNKGQPPESGSKTGKTSPKQVPKASDGGSSKPAPAKSDKAPPPAAAKAAPARAAAPKKPAPRANDEGQRAQIEALRKQLTRDSEAHWTHYLEAVAQRQRKGEDDEGLSEAESPQVAEWVHLQDVDYTRQFEVRGIQVVFHDDPNRQPWALLIEEGFNTLIELGREVETPFGFERVRRWDVVGRVAGYDSFYDDASYRTRKVPTLRVNALRRPGQFVVFRHPKHGPQVPGLSDAREKLEAIHARVTIPVVKEPKDLLDTLFSVVATGNVARFRELLADPGDPRMVRRRFEQFVKAYTLSSGRLRFERYDAERRPEAPGAEGEVKLFVERANDDGTVSSKPLTFVKEGTAWKLKAGVL